MNVFFLFRILRKKHALLCFLFLYPFQTFADPPQKPDDQLSPEERLAKFYAEMLLNPEVPMTGLGELLHPLSPIVRLPSITDGGYNNRQSSPTFYVHNPTLTYFRFGQNQQLLDLIREGQSEFHNFATRIAADNEFSFTDADSIIQDVRSLGRSYNFPIRDPEKQKTSPQNKKLTALQLAQIKGMAQSDFLKHHQRRPTNSAQDAALLGAIEAKLTLKAEQEQSPQLRAEFREESPLEYAKRIYKDLREKKNKLLLESLQELKRQNVDIEFNYYNRIGDPLRLGPPPHSPTLHFTTKTPAFDILTLKFDPTTGNILAPDGMEIVIPDLENIKLNPTLAIYPLNAGLGETPFDEAALIKPDPLRIHALEQSVAKLQMASELSDLRSNAYLRAQNKQEASKQLRNYSFLSQDPNLRSRSAFNLLQYAENGESFQISRLKHGYSYRYLKDKSALRWGLFADDELNPLKRELRAIALRKPHFQRAIDDRGKKLKRLATLKNLWARNRSWAIPLSKLTAITAAAHIGLSGLITSPDRSFSDNLQTPIENVANLVRPLLSESEKRTTDTLPALSGKVGEPTNDPGSSSNPNAEEPLRFTVSGNQDSHNEFFYTGTKEELGRGNSWLPKKRYLTPDSVQLIPQANFLLEDRYAAIPAMSNYDLTNLEVETWNHKTGLKKLKLGQDYEVRHIPETGLYGIEFKADHESIRILPTFDPTQSRSVEKVPIALKAMDVAKLKESSQQLREAKLIAIANALDKEIAKGSPISIDDIRRVVSETSIYSHEKEIKKWNLAGLFSSNPYLDFTKFVKSGIACGECDMGNALYAQILRQTLPSEYDVIERAVEVANDGKIGTIGHVVVEIREKATNRIFRLDATPARHSSASNIAMREFKSEIEEKERQLFEATQEDLKALENKAPDLEKKDIPTPNKEHNNEKIKIIADRPKRQRPTRDEVSATNRAVATGPANIDPESPSPKQTSIHNVASKEFIDSPSGPATVNEVDLQKIAELEWKRKWGGRLEATYQNFNKNYLAALNTFVRPAKSKLTPRDLARLGFHIRDPLQTLASISSYFNNRLSIEDLAKNLGLAVDPKNPAQVFEEIDFKVTRQADRIALISEEMPKLLSEISLKTQKKGAQIPTSLLVKAGELLGIPYSELSKSHIIENINLFAEGKYAGSLIGLTKELNDALKNRPIRTPTPKDSDTLPKTSRGIGCAERLK